MLVFLDANLTFLAVPKTGTTAVELALQHRADIIFQRDRKHITARRYRKRVAPFLAQTFGVRPKTVAVMRAPVDQLGSWYRYRARPECDATPVSTRDIPFEDFVQGVIASKPLPFADVGSQFRFLTGGRGRLIVDHLFAWEAPERFVAFLSDRLDGQVELDFRNVSLRIDMTLSAETEAALRTARAADFALHDRLMAAGGYLGPDTART